MSVQQPESFKLFEELYRTEFFTACRAIHQPTSTNVRLTRMAAEISESPEFRAAFRKDETSLNTLHHANILSLLFWGEDNGLLFYATEFPAGETLEQRLAAGQQFSWDEFTDIGWQIASALQHAHNSGVTHGHLSTNSVNITDDLRAQVAGFGLYRWIATVTSKETAEAPWSELARQDLIDFGKLLHMVLQSVTPESESAADESQVSEMRSLIDDLKTPQLDFTARDVQGRLGNLLLKVAGESIEMIDHRKGQGISRRSIVDELFDDVDASRNSHPSSSALAPASAKPTGSTWLIAIVLIIVAGGLIVVIMQQ